MVAFVGDSPTIISFLGFLDFGILVKMRAKSSNVSIVSSTSVVRPMSITFVAITLNLSSLLNIVIFVACTVFVDTTVTIVFDLDISILSRSMFLELSLAPAGFSFGGNNTGC